MDRAYWERIAPRYNEEIFDVLKNDEKGYIVNAISKYASPRKTVIDIGCAIGKWLPVLSPLFKKVLAVDISQENLAIAQEHYSELDNIEYLRLDMSDPETQIRATEMGICINAILTESMEKRKSFFENLKKCIKRKGHLILVVPSLESYLLSSIVRQRWDPDKDAEDTVDRNTSAEELNNLLQGNAAIDQVPTKHYLREELEMLLKRTEFLPLRFQKIEYPWSTEFHRPPAWLQGPYPWDWMVVARKL